MAEARATANRLAASMGALQAPVAAARERWGDYLPEGPSYAETEDAALIERRENSAPWSDPEFAAARARLFLAALALHKALIRANAPVMEANLAVWTDLVSGAASGPDPANGPGVDGGPGVNGGPPPEVALAAWRSFFLAVPAASVTYSSCGTLLAGLGRGSVGWLLAAGAEEVPPRHVAGLLWRANRAVLAGNAAFPFGGANLDEDCALSLAARATRFGTWLPDGTWTGLPLHPRRGPASPSALASPSVLTRPSVLPQPPAFPPPPASLPPSALPRPGRVALPPPAPSSDTETLQAILSELRERARSRRTG
jgi:hypothetical protein